jgi:hypothetical protein
LLIPSDLAIADFHAASYQVAKRTGWLTIAHQNANQIVRNGNRPRRAVNAGVCVA